MVSYYTIMTHKFTTVNFYLIHCLYINIIMEYKFTSKIHYIIGLDMQYMYKNRIVVDELYNVQGS